MTVLINIGRRVPRRWFKRQASKVQGLMSFQENIWMIVKQSLNMAKKKANASGRINFVMTTSYETEDLNYQIEWIKIIIQGNEKEEEEEYNESLQLYQPLGKILKRDIPKDDVMRKHLKTKVLSGVKVDEAYKKGYGAVNDNNISNKLLEMGIMTHMEWVKDFDSRDDYGCK